MAENRPRILAFVDNYLPGYKFGGPGKALANTVDNLGDELDFWVVTSDRDLGDTEPYPDVPKQSWHPVGKARAYYVERAKATLGRLRRLIRQVQPDVIYLNSFLSRAFTIKPLLLRRLHLISDARVVAAPRGELAPGALALKSRLKRVFIAAVKAAGLYRGVTWQALSPKEESEIRGHFGDRAGVMIARNIISFGSDGRASQPQREKVPGELKVVFLSRISKLKNLPGALEIMKGVDCPVEFNIYGPKADSWSECEALINTMRPNVRVNYMGGVGHDRVQSVLNDHDLFFLPTFSEGAATAVIEALVVGCPVLISTNTPYRDLEREQAGWDIPLDQPEAFRAALRRCAEMDASVHQQWRRGARNYGLKFADTKAVLEEHRRLLGRPKIAD